MYNVAVLGTCPQFSLSYPPNGTYSCPGSNITYTCGLNSSAPGAVITIFKGSAFVCPFIGNKISLTQKSGGVLNPTASGICGSLSAVTTNISTDGTCYTSVLTIPAVQALNETTAMCVDGFTSAVVGSDTLKITSELCGICNDLMFYPHLPSPPLPQSALVLLGT